MPVELNAFAKVGGLEDREATAPVTSIYLDDWDIRKASIESDRLVTVKLPGMNIEACASTTDLLRVTQFMNSREGEYTLNLHLDSTKATPGILRSELKFNCSEGLNLAIAVYVKIISDYTARPSSLYLGILPRDSITEMSIAIISDLGLPLKVAQVSSSRPDFASVRETGTGQLLCRFDGSQGLGNQSGQFDVVLAGTPQRKIKVPFIAWISKKGAL